MAWNLARFYFGKDLERRRKDSASFDFPVRLIDSFRIVVRFDDSKTGRALKIRMLEDRTSMDSIITNENSDSGSRAMNTDNHCAIIIIEMEHAMQCARACLTFFCSRCCGAIYNWLPVYGSISR